MDFDKPITEYIKDWPAKHPPITTRHLASHSSGIRHYKEDPEASEEVKDSKGDSKYPEFYSNVKYATVSEALDVFKDDDLISEPGTT